jgi:cation diffusion facilitator CzcD-associated flavoprotein CzcO
MNQHPSTCVIGAGPSGLVATKVLLEHGIPVTCYEAGERVGGQWVLDNTSGTSAAYRSLTVNTHKGMSRYSDFTLPEAYPDFPSHEEMADWFASYAEHFGLMDQIRLGSRVNRVRRLDDGRWEVRTTAGDVCVYDALVVAVGNLWDPVQPDFEGCFDGRIFHAKEYMDPRDPVDCSDATVLVVGLGNTACEIAVELGLPGNARRVLISARSGNHFLPRRLGGNILKVPHPSDPLGAPFRWLPRPLRDAFFGFVFPRVIGRMLAGRPRPEDVGLPPPPTTPFEKRVVVNDHLLERLLEGAIEAKPTIRRLAGSKVEFSDGSVEEIDVLIAATGYRLSLPFFEDGLPGLEENDLALYRGVMHPEYHNLFVVGIMRAICSIWSRSEQQMRFVAPLLSGEYALPSEREIRRQTYPVLGVPYGNCQFHTHDLQRELERGRRRARRAGRRTQRRSE